MLDFGGEYGCDSASNPLAGSAVGDTWTFANGSWSNLTGTLGTAPSARFWASMAWDALDQRMILVGGCNSCSSDLPGTWNWSHGAWHLENTSGAPPARSRAPMAYDSTDHEIVLFGGYNHSSGTALSDTWTYVGGKWSHPTLNGPSPSPRFASVLVDDPAAHGLILFGGQDGLSSPLNDTWLFSGSTWTKISTPVAPSAVWDAAGAYDASAQGVVVFGGCSAGGCLNSTNATWLFRNGTWTDLDPRLAVLPPERGSFGFAADPNASALLLFGGIGPTARAASGSTRFNDTWEFRTPLFASATDPSVRLDLGQSLALNVSAFGGTGPLLANGSGLPSGCPTGTFALPLQCTPSTTGTFFAWANVSDPTGSTVRVGPWTVQVELRPVAHPIASPASGTAPLPVSLKANVTGGTSPMNLTWTMGSTTLGWGAVLNRTFPVSGSFTVDLAGVDAVGVTMTGAVQVTVRAAIAPLAASSSETTGMPFCLAGSPFVNLTLTASASGGTAPYAFRWTLLGTAYDGGDVNVTVGTNATFPVVLVVNDSGGQSVRRGTNVSTPDFACLSALALTTVAAPFCQSGGGWDNLTVTARATGGTAPYSFAWLVGSETFSGPSATAIVPAGTRVAVTLNVTDSLGRHAVATADPSSASVTCGGIAPAKGGSSIALSTLEVALLALGIGVAALIGGLILRRRSSPPPAAHAIPPGATASSPGISGGPRPASSNAPDVPPPERAPSGVTAIAGDAPTWGGAPGRPTASSPPSPKPLQDPPRENRATADLILLHLSRQPTPRADDLAPLELTQEGIEQGIGRPQSSFARVLQRLEANGSIQSETRHVRGAARRKKVYLLTPLGVKLARELRQGSGPAARADDQGAR